MRYVGLGKTLYSSSLCTLTDGKSDFPEPVIFLSERYERVKNSGKSPVFLAGHLDLSPVESEIAESSDVAEALLKENILNEKIPFFELIKSRNLTTFSAAFNPSLRTIGHHHAHAAAAVLRSPFEKALVFVLDGAGSSVSTLRKIGTESDLTRGEREDSYEHLSVYLFDHGELTPVKKEFMSFAQTGEMKSLGTSPGIFYENISRYIFNSQTDPGKVMGLAAFGKGEVVTDFLDYQKKLNWKKAFSGKTKIEWENHPEKENFIRVAATAQSSFEHFFLGKLQDIRKEFPEYGKLILTGGCALNCTANWKLQAKNLFEEIYVAPNPGDESIGLGCATALWLEKNKANWKAFPWERQNSFLGKDIDLDSSRLKEIFRDYEITVSDNISLMAAEAIHRGEVIAWFQGRSECGPRALGHRSILARPDRPDLKNYLNEKIKFRESFRPYGCTVLGDEAPKYFLVPPHFKNPFMSFAVPVKEEWKDLLSHVTHVDGTSRMQTLESTQDELFYRLLSDIKTLTGHGLVLNTSLNVMNEPILESAEDALRFFKGSAVDALFIGQCMIRKASHV